MTTFHLLRHGEKDAEEGLMIGRMPGIHLTAKGRAEARALTAHLAKTPIKHIYSSPLERAQETAAPLAEAKKLPVEITAAFHEIDMGEWTGKTERQLARVKSWRRFCQFHGGTAIPGGETLVEVQARMVSEMIRLAQRFPRDGIAIATHEDPIRLAICHFIGAPIEVYTHITIRPASVTILTLDNHRAILERMDEVPPAKRPRTR
jgi:probable phosphoglycerate mutase